ncbi:MAG: D-aminoacyl-tRNA deacylase [Clostridia bacterium]|nr:D-aminoacyl-tRNA deacylase [Clostridia bacterium]
MRAVIQRVLRARVDVDGKRISEIDKGLLVLLGIRKGDGTAQADFIAEKLANLRIFCDEDGKLNLSVLDIGAEILVVSNFTVYGNAQKGRRPDFCDAGGYKESEILYNYVIERLKVHGVGTYGGVFGGDMQVSLVNDGPVTLILDRD